ncbi:hypothetical protein F5Y19DRAFT_36703 [Xylariaceae sp. FL1651]|nr:hypothetical protein F5Y19DRAFT_36703 [Xylariaceae sp. FL1651]
MAPRVQAQRRQTQSQNEHVYELGKVGRKTGIMLPDTGRRDEHGFERLDNLFSSPDKDINGETNDRGHTVSEDEQDMEIDDGSELGPATIRKLQQRQGRPSLPRARSPIKTNLQSPARQNPHLGPTSSPLRGSVVTAHERSPKQVVARRLDFSAGTRLKKPFTNGHAKASGVKARNEKLANGHSQSSDSDEEAIPHGNSEQIEDEEESDESMQMLNAGGDDGGIVEQDDISETHNSDEIRDETSMIQEIKSARKSKPPGRRGRKPKITIEKGNEDVIDASVSVTTDENDAVKEPPVKRRGRPKAAPRQEAKEPTPPTDPSPPLKTSKRGRPARTSIGDVEEGSNAGAREVKRQKTEIDAKKSTSSKPAAAKEKSKPGRKRKSSGTGVDSPMIQRGPPLPRSRGLVTVRREESTDMRTTRSGRASYKPLEWWKGEHVEYDEDNANIFDDVAGKRHFKMPTVKGVVRTEESQEAAPKRRGRPPTGRRPGRRPSMIQEEDIEREEWEDNPGRVTGEVIYWYPEHEFEPPDDEDQVEVVPEELAISENAIQLKDIKDATFRFAKTLTLPFFGSGIVDLPPGAEKRPKNSRKMHLVFFVHTGSVQVTIAQTTFGIAKGGMFFVPRGNHYSILNESDRHARIFFAQGCEVLVQPENED